MIIWIASYPKSGNTWIRALIEAWHLGEVDINNMRISSGDNDPYPYQIVAPLPMAELPIEEKLMLRPAALLHMAKIYHRRPLLLKTHHANINTSGIDLIPPPVTAKAVYIVRDPRDTAISIAEHMGLSIDDAIARMAQDNWTIGRSDKPPHVLTDWSGHVSSWTNGDKFPIITVRYEDLLTDPVGSFSQVLKFLGWTTTRQRLLEAIDAAIFENLQEQETEHGFNESSPKTERFFCRGTSGHWRKLLSNGQAEHIECDHADIMHKLGYLTASRKAA